MQDIILLEKKGRYIYDQDEIIERMGELYIGKYDSEQITDPNEYQR